MLIPLQQFICDRCGEVIRNPDHGWVEWLDDGKANRNFKIVHDLTNTPFAPKKGSCFIHEGNPACNSAELKAFLGTNGLVRLYSLLDPGPMVKATFDGPEVANVRDFVEFAKRLTVPYFEEARGYFDKAKKDGILADFNEFTMYCPDTMKMIVEKYSSRST